MIGPLAPKDPQEKRKGFYVLIDQNVGGLPQDDGTGRHPIYLDNDRLTTLAKIVGGITDEDMLQHLLTAEGFRSMVHSIGVAVSAEKADMPVDFTFMLYGENGAGSGSSYTFRLRADGAEQVIQMDQLPPTQGERTPGQFLFQLPEMQDVAAVTVKLYLRDGFDAPEMDPDPPVEFDSPLYREMIARSFLSGGNNSRIKGLLKRARAGEDVTVAFLGGSITQGAGAVPIQENCYARLTYEALKQRYAAGDNLHYIKAGVGGTPSETGLMRYDRDITRDGTVAPDLVVVEFAVNDASDETEGVFHESLIRKILEQPNRPAVIMLFSVFANDWNLKDRLAPIGYRYQVPMVDVLEAVSPQFTKKPGEGLVLTKRQYFYDVFHPSNTGHRVMRDCLLYLIDRLDHQQLQTPVEGYVPPCYGADYTALRLLDRKDGLEGATITPGSFTETDDDLQAVPLDDAAENTPEFPYNWKKGPGDEPFVLELTCSKLVLEFKDSGDTAFGKARVRIDGLLSRIIDPREAGWTHCHTTVLIHRRESTLHRVEIEMDPEDRDKVFTILGFGYVR
ncbi:MAG: SGNH/GDSL hydrolase family protein [Clostridiales bacterium]|nr:SGNH/GDSL hydrolase family protein [Clostridiales bacterium]